MPCVPGSSFATAPDQRHHPDGQSGGPRGVVPEAAVPVRDRLLVAREVVRPELDRAPLDDVRASLLRPVGALPVAEHAHVGRAVGGPIRVRPRDRVDWGQPGGTGWNGLGQDLRGGLRWHAGSPRWWRRGRRLGHWVGTDDIHADRPVDERRSGANAGAHSQDTATRRARRAGQGHLRGAITRGARNPEAEADLACAGHHHGTRPSTDAQRAVATARRNDRPKDHSFARPNGPAQGVRLGGLRGGHGQAKRGETGRRPSP